MPLTGLSFIGSQRGETGGAAIYAINPATGERVDPVYHSASAAEVDQTVQLASQAFPVYAALSGKEKGALLRGIADGLDAIQQQLADRAHLETALPMPRLLGEVTRTTGQLRVFASLVEEGSWVEARIDSAMPDRKPLPRPNLRSMLRPLGPVVVIGPSNFPLAFSVAGGDTASALAPPIPEPASWLRRSSSERSPPPACPKAFSRCSSMQESKLVWRLCVIRWCRPWHSPDLSEPAAR